MDEIEKVQAKTPDHSPFDELPKVVVAHLTFQTAISGEPSEGSLSYPIQSYLRVRKKHHGRRLLQNTIIQHLRLTHVLVVHRRSILSGNPIDTIKMALSRYHSSWKQNFTLAAAIGVESSGTS